MKTAQLNEKTYFCDVAHDDIDAVLRDLRQTHKTDFETTPDDSTAQTIMRSFQRATSLNGSRLEQQAFFFCEQLGIDPHKVVAGRAARLCKAAAEIAHFVSAADQKEAAKKKVIFCRKHITFRHS